MLGELKIYLTYGKKGSGKSLTQAKDALELFAEYEKNEKRWPQLPKRIYFGNQKFNEEIEKKELNKHLFYWSNAKQLRFCPRPQCWKGKIMHPVHDTDIGHDEIGKDFSAGSWADTPKWLKQIFSHLRKRGNRYYANTQVYEDIDIAFRRQIDYAYRVEKIFGSGDITATRPPITKPWGLLIRKEFDPQLLEWEREESKRENRNEIKGKIMQIPELILIRKKYVDAYDTQHEIPPYKPDTLEHIEIWCEDPNCEKHGHGNPMAKPKIEHYKI